MSSKKKLGGSVAIVGAGPGDPGLLTQRAAELLRAAEVVVTTAQLAEQVAPWLNAAAEVRDDGVAEAVRAGKRVVRLVPGDPFERAADVAEALSFVKAKLPFEVVPGIAVAAGVTGYAGIPLGSAHTVLAVDAGESADWAAAVAAEGTLAITVAASGIGKVATALVEHGRPGDALVCVTSNGTTARQRTVVGTLETIERDTAGFVGPTVLTVGVGLAHREKLSWWESRPLFGWTVLVPRTRAQAGEMTELLRTYGAQPLEVPTIAVEAPRTPAPMERAIKGLVSGRYAWVVFTSTNAVKAVREKLEEVGLDARAFAGVRIAAVGEATSTALIEFGLRADLAPSKEQSSDGLLADFPPFDDVFDLLDRVFLPRADIATETLVAGLKERGWAVDDITAYRTVRAAPPAAEVREAIKGGGVDAVLFTSSSTARNLVGIAGKPHERTVIACIGPQTAATCRELGLRVDVLAPVPSVSALASALADFALARAAEPVPEPVAAPRRRSKR